MNTLNIILPLYNEEKTIFKFINNFAYTLIKLTKIRTIKRINIIFFDDGSNDNSIFIIKKKFNENLYKNKKLNFIYKKNQYNSGKSNAIINSLKLIHSGYVYIQDTDLELDPIILIKFLNYYKKNKADFIIGNRNSIKKINFKNFFYCIGLFLTNILVNKKNKFKFNDIHCGCKLFKYSLIKNYNFKSKNFFFDTEICFVLDKLTNKIAQIDIKSQRRSVKEGKKLNMISGISLFMQTVYFCLTSK
jgi:cellulose synthase/poly-beta-1,6-N-acetylglucosamine synthase-like glycosyltransferase